MIYGKKNLNELKKDRGNNTFKDLLNKKENKKLIDLYIMISPDNSKTERVTAGYTMVYPGCSPKGEKHSEYEEIYFITKGKGIVQIDDVKFEAETGDCFYIPFGLFHKVNNPNNENLEFFWVSVANSL